jgi:predicted RNase H-like nuclease (RuvC/YqgF family)
VASEFDESEFVDSDFQAARKSGYVPVGPGLAARPPTREELEVKVSETHQRLAELKRVQEELERERAALEEARRRRSEFQVGREEMLQHLTRGIGILEEAEFTARRDAEQMAKTLGELRESLVKVQNLNDQVWTQDNYNVELTRALTTIENARMEWNSAQLKWSNLSGDAGAGAGAAAGSPPETPVAALTTVSLPQLCRLGLALTWPLTVAAVAAAALLLVLLLRR